MQLVRFNPNRSLFPFGRRTSHLFDDFFSDAFNTQPAQRNGSWNPKVDVLQEENQIVVKAELPGVDKENIEIDVDGRVLTIKGERASGKEVENENYTLRERSYGKFQRSFTLPDETDSETIKAEYKDGVLELSIPKPESKKPRQITIQ